MATISSTYTNATLTAAQITSGTLALNQFVTFPTSKNSRTEVAASVSRYQHYLDPEVMPVFNSCYDPAFLNAFKWGRYGEWLGSSSEHPDIAGLVQTNMRSKDIILEWISAMYSGLFTFGYGVLRDGADRFSPLGVLAAISEADWKWDETEGCYRTGKGADPCELDYESFYRFLEVNPTYYGYDSSQTLRYLTTLADTSSSFKPTIDYLRKVLQMVRERQEEYISCYKARKRNQYLPRSFAAACVVNSPDTESSTISWYEDVRCPPEDWQEFKNTFEIVYGKY